MNITTKRFGGLIAGVAAAALLALPAIAAAQHGGGGGGGGHGGGGGGGGGAHFAGGGGHFGGGYGGGAHFGGYGGAHFAGPRYGGGFASSSRMSAAPHYGYSTRYSAGAPHYAASSGWSNGHASGWSGHGATGWSGHGVTGVGVHSGLAVHSGVATHSWYGSHWGYHPSWGGGWWRGGWWPRAYYGWAFPWFFPVLPIGYATFWWSGVPFYYVNSVYYTWDPSQSGYVVTNPPPVGGDASDSIPPDQGGNPADQGSGGPGAPSSAADDVFMYPQNGQSQQQQSTDRYECHKWAQDQTGFDPTQPNGGTGSANPDDYRRAMVACLQGRGYSVQ